MAMIPDLTNNKASTGGSQQASEGWHALRIASIEERTNEKGNTSHLVVFEALDEPGAVARDNFTIKSTSGANVEVGRNRYKGLIQCLGIGTYSGLDTAHLVGRAVRGRVVHDPFKGREGQDLVSAKVAAYEPLQQAQAPAAAPQAAAPAVADESAPF